MERMAHRTFDVFLPHGMVDRNDLHLFLDENL
jgi:hypothetical protein